MLASQGCQEGWTDIFALSGSEAKQNVEKKAAGHTVVLPGDLLHRV